MFPMAARVASYNFGIIMLGRGMLGSCGSSLTLLCFCVNILKHFLNIMYFNIPPTYTDTDAHNGHGKRQHTDSPDAPSDFVLMPLHYIHQHQQIKSGPGLELQQ